MVTGAAIERPEVHESEVDGVPAYWAPMEGPINATLQFDGGICVEPPHLRGVQHLLEHLVLAGVGPQIHEYNGFVDLRRLAFTVRGDRDEVRSFFEVVSKSLAGVPVDRHQLEPGVLGAEALRTPGSVMTNLLSYLFGAAGPGVAAFPELAVRAVDPPDLHAWAGQRIHTGTAALSCSADPSFLDFGGLPEGAPSRPWSLPAQIEGPGWIAGNASGFAAVAVMRRTTATATMLRVLRDHVLDYVRHRDGVSYSVEVVYEPMTADQAIVGLFVDAAPDRRVKARNALFEALDGFAVHGPELRWLELDRGRVTRANREPSAGFALANRAAAERLLGKQNPVNSAWFDEYLALTPGVLAESAIQFLDAASWQMPNEAPMPPWRNLGRLGILSEFPVDGRELVPTGTPRYRMIAGAAGLSVVHGPERVVTARFADVVAVEAWDDGSRVLFTRDATRITFNKPDWAETPEFVTWLDACVSDKPVIRRGPRPS